MKKRCLVVLMISIFVVLTGCKTEEKTEVGVIIKDYITINDKNREYFKSKYFTYLEVGNNFMVYSDGENAYLFNIKNNERELLSQDSYIRSICFDSLEFCLMDLDNLVKIDYDGTVTKQLEHKLPAYEEVSADNNQITLCNIDPKLLRQYHCAELIVLDHDLNEIGVYNDVLQVGDFLFASGNEVFELENNVKKVTKTLESEIRALRREDNTAVVILEESYVVYVDDQFVFESENNVYYSNGKFVEINDVNVTIRNMDGTIFKEITVTQEYPLVTYINPSMYYVTAQISNETSVFKMDGTLLYSFESETRIFNPLVLSSKGSEYFVAMTSNYRDLLIYHDGSHEIYNYYGFDIAPFDNLYFSIDYGSEQDGIFQVIDGVKSDFTTAYLDTLDDIQYFKQLSADQFLVIYDISDERYAAVFDIDGTIHVEGSFIGFTSFTDGTSNRRVLINEDGTIVSVAH